MKEEYQVEKIRILALTVFFVLVGFAGLLFFGDINYLSWFDFLRAGVVSVMATFVCDVLLDGEHRQNRKRGKAVRRT